MKQSQPIHKLQVDVIIPSLSKPELHQMIKECIQSLRSSEAGIDFNIIIVESGATVELGQDQTIRYDRAKFNFHHALNQGLEASSNHWVVLANNDLLFHRNWMSKIISVKDQHPDVRSFSPWDPKSHPTTFTSYKPLHYGYRIGKELAGWCIVTTRDVLKKVKLTEEVSFWYSDNSYADELQRYNMSHVLVTDSQVTHLCSQTLSKVPNRDELTTGQAAYYKGRKEDVALTKAARLTSTIGVAITTYNRPKILEASLQHWTTFKPSFSEMSLTIVVVDDGSTAKNRTLNEELCLKYGVSYTYQSNQGIAHAKNMCLKMIYTCDFMFLADDDAFPKKDGWADLYIQTFYATGNHHMMFLPPGKLNNKVLKENSVVQQMVCCFGVLLFMTKDLVHKIGGFDKRMRFYGHEHTQWSMRAHYAGFTPFGQYLSPKTAEKFFYSLDFSFKDGEQPPLCAIKKFASSIATSQDKKDTIEESIMHNAELLHKPYLWMPV